MKTKTAFLRLLALSLALLLALTLLVACGDDDAIDARPDDVDTDGDGIPDSVDKEADDNTDNDNVVDIGGMFG